MTSFGALIHISMMMISWDIITKVPKKYVVYCTSSPNLLSSKGCIYY